MSKRYILGIDPSGAYNEGKGTTGFCILDYKTKEVVDSSELSAKPFSTAEAYWNAHMKYIQEVNDKYQGDLLLSIEDYILYGNKAMSQTNSSMETSQLIGILKMYCFTNNIRYTIRPAVRVKNRWTNDILERTGHIKKTGGRWYNKQGQRLNKHMIDAMRHALHCAHFENKEEKWQ